MKEIKKTVKNFWKNFSLFTEESLLIERVPFNNAVLCGTVYYDEKTPVKTHAIHGFEFKVNGAGVKFDRDSGISYRFFLDVVKNEFIIQSEYWDQHQNVPNNYEISILKMGDEMSFRNNSEFGEDFVLTCNYDPKTGPQVNYYFEEK